MDDATASDNCGEVTIEVSSTIGDAAGNYTIGRCRFRTPQFTFVPADYTVECSDEMHG